VFHLQFDSDCLSPTYRQSVSRLIQVPLAVLEDFQRGILLAALLSVPRLCGEARVCFQVRQLMPDDPSRHQLFVQVVYVVAEAPTSAVAGWVRDTSIRRGFRHACAECWQSSPDAALGLAYDVSCLPRAHLDTEGGQ
jgi:hypothetical protein